MNNYNKLNTTNAHEFLRRMKLYLGKSHDLFRDTNINHYKQYKDLDMQIYGIWLEAINICALRSMYVPTEILDDFYYAHKEEE